MFKMVHCCETASAPCTVELCAVLIVPEQIISISLMS